MRTSGTSPKKIIQQYFPFGLLRAAPLSGSALQKFFEMIQLPLPFFRHLLLYSKQELGQKQGASMTRMDSGWILSLILVR